MTPQSAKAKGMKRQQWVRDLLITKGLKTDDVQSRSMGAAGEDVMLSPYARESFPYSIECKNTERVNIWKAYAQASDILESGIDTSSLALPINIEFDFGASSLDSKVVNVLSCALVDAIYTLDSQGMLTVSI